MTYHAISLKELREFDVLRTLQNCHECDETFTPHTRIYNLEESAIFLCDQCHNEKVNY